MKSRARRKSISEQLRFHLQNCGQSQYEIAQATNIDPGMLSRFTRCQRSLTLTTVDRLAEYLNLRLVRGEGE